MSPTPEQVATIVRQALEATGGDALAALYLLANVVLAEQARANAYAAAVSHGQVRARMGRAA